MIKRQHMLSFQTKKKICKSRKGVGGLWIYYYLLIKEIIIMVNAMLWNYANLHPKEQKRNQKRAMYHTCLFCIRTYLCIRR